MKRMIVICLAALMVLSMCGKKAVLRKYYLIEMPAGSMPDSTEHILLPVKVDVRDFEISRAVDQTRIALRSNSNEMNYYFYHHWAVRPGAGIADMVFQVLQHHAAFERLTRGFSSQPDYIVTGNMLHLERNETGKTISASISGTIELIDKESGGSVLRHTFDRNEPFKDDKNMNAFAKTVSRILYDETERFVSEMTGMLNQPVPGDLP
ncbi:membrane integrity-associated transporter subunit PqiC [bacterium]|nr:membrane integrity-associated transporter subunit PqiC [bacterium]